MAIDSKHPQYADHSPDWGLMRDTHAGERQIKDQGERYLPVTAGQREDGMRRNQSGWRAYEAYKKRASFPDIVTAAVEAMLGVMHHKPPVIELPDKMEPLREIATLEGESLEMLLRRINEEQLITGRLGLLPDVQDGAPVGSTPYIAMYHAETILNWDSGARDDLVLRNLNLVVLDESEHERDGNFEWKMQQKYRVLVLGEIDANEPTGVGVYQTGVFRDSKTNFSVAGMVTPSLAGKNLDFIPFTFINAKDVVPAPDHPPLLGLGRLAVTIYRGEADYRQGLFMQGQDTLVVIGETDPDKVHRTGANASINLPVGGEAMFIGVESSGLKEQRAALENDRGEAAQKGGQLLDSVSRQKESGDALKIRVAARTATLNQIALAGAFGLQSTLRHIAVWMGADPEKVVVTPNLDFVDDALEGKTLVEYMSAKQMGAPLSLRSIHTLMEERDLTELTFEEELAELATEEALDLTGTREEGPVEDEDEDEEPEENVGQ